jgi:hypothetical protein
LQPSRHSRPSPRLQATQRPPVAGNFSVSPHHHIHLTTTMSTPSLNSTSSPTLNGRSIKINKLRKVIVLKLQPDVLAQFLPKPVPRSNFKTKSSPSLASTSNNLSAAAPVPQTSSTDEASESNSTPVPNTDQPTTDETPKKTVTKGPKPGSKRGLGLGSDSMPKPRGKPGPKKKPRL